MNFLSVCLKKIHQQLKNRLEGSSLMILPYSVVAIIAFPVFLFMYVQTERWWLNTCGAILGIITLMSFKNFILKKEHVYIYWFVLLVYGLPFDFTYGILTNPHNVSYQLGGMLCLIVLSITISDMLMLFVTLFLGGFLALLITNSSILDLVKSADLSHTGLFYLLGFAFSIALMQRKNATIQAKLNGVLSLAHCMAHELGTPLSTIKLNSLSLQQYIPKLIAGYQKAEEAKLGVDEIPMPIITRLERAVKNIETEATAASQVTKMLLLNAQQGGIFSKETYRWTSMYNCIQEALDKYPYPDGFDKETQIHWQKSEDFEFYGVDMLMTYVFFNLLKNAIRAILEQGKGDITISSCSDHKYNYVEFTDTAIGIKKEEQKRLFTSFYTNYKEGTGLGLYFCKSSLENFSGEISCKSRHGSYVTFILRLPKK